MTYYGIFNLQNGTYTLLRYSDIPQTGGVRSKFDYASKTHYTITEVCLPNVPYVENSVGKEYDPETGVFLD